MSFFTTRSRYVEDFGHQIWHFPIWIRGISVMALFKLKKKTAMKENYKIMFNLFYHFCLNFIAAKTHLSHWAQPIQLGL